MSLINGIRVAILYYRESTLINKFINYKMTKLLYKILLV